MVLLARAHEAVFGSGYYRLGLCFLVLGVVLGINQAAALDFSLVYLLGVLAWSTLGILVWHVR